MSDNLMSRRKFLLSAGTVAAATGLAGVGLAKVASPADAAAGQEVPWPYPTVEADQPNPEALARRAFEVYMGQSGAGRGCAEATWWPFVESLSGVTGGSGTWGTLPLNIFRFGAGGVVGLGHHLRHAQRCCRDHQHGRQRQRPPHDAHQRHLPVLRGDARCLRTAPGSPTRTRSVWALAWAPTTLPLENVPSSTANSPLCHSSLVQWTMTTNATNGGPLQKDRCGKACFDVARKLAEMLNAYFVALAAHPDLHAGGRAARSGRGCVRYVPCHVHGREDGAAAPAMTTRSPTTIWTECVR